MNQKGFTLIEMIIAVAVLTTLSVIAMPNFVHNFQNMRLDNEASELAVCLEHLREKTMHYQAIHNDFTEVGGEVAPKFEFRGNRYVLREGLNVIHSHELPSFIHCSMDKKNVVFYPRGAANPTTITMSSGNRVRYVIIDIAGRVRVSENPPKNW